MSNSHLSSLTSINEELGDDFDSLVDKCKAYREIILKRKHDALEKVYNIFKLAFVQNCGI